MHMTLSEYARLFYGENNRASIKHLYSPCMIFLLLSGFLVAVVSAEVSADPVEEKYYLRIGHNIPSDNSDLDITSVGMLSLKDNMMGNLDLSYIESGNNGDALTLDLEGGYAFVGDLSLYFALGISLGYNWESDDYIAAYFPEVGLVMDLSKTFGITLSGKRYFNLYQEDENVVMFALVFRK